MVRDDNEQSSLSARVGTVEGRLGALESTMDSMVQEIKMISLKFDDQSLANGAYWSGRERSLNNLPPPPPPLSGNPHQQPRQLSPPPRRHQWQLPFEDPPDEEELINTLYPEDDFKDEGYDGRTAYGKVLGGWRIQIPTSEKDFLFLTHIGG